MMDEPEKMGQMECGWIASNCCRASDRPYCGGAPLGRVKYAATSIAATMPIATAQGATRISAAGASFGRRRGAGRNAHENQSERRKNQRPHPLTGTVSRQKVRGSGARVVKECAAGRPFLTPPQT